MGIIVAVQGDPMRAILAGVNVGGDTDTIASIAGSICGALYGIQALDEKLVSFFNYTKQIGAVVVYLRGGDTYSYSNYPNIRGIAGIDRSVWAPAAADPGKVYLFDTFEGVTRNVGAKNMISLAVCPAPDDESAIEAILVMLRVPYFDGLSARWGEEPGSAVVIFGRSGKPILSSLPAGTRPDELAALASRAASAAGAEAGFSSGEVRADGRAWLATFYPMHSTGWTLALLAERRIPIDDIDEDKVTASFKNGVLTVTLPKTATASDKVKRIAIKGE